MRRSCSNRISSPLQLKTSTKRPQDYLKEMPPLASSRLEVCTSRRCGAWANMRMHWCTATLCCMLEMRHILPLQESWGGVCSVAATPLCRGCHAARRTPSAGGAGPRGRGRQDG